MSWHFWQRPILGCNIGKRSGPELFVTQIQIRSQTGRRELTSLKATSRLSLFSLTHGELWWHDCPTYRVHNSLRFWTILVVIKCKFVLMGGRRALLLLAFACCFVGGRHIIPPPLAGSMSLRDLDLKYYRRHFPAVWHRGSREPLMWFHTLYLVCSIWSSH